MREFGVSKLTTSDGFVFERPASVAEFALPVPPTSKSNSAADAAEPLDDDADEETRDAHMRAKWDAHWSRLVASSGAPMPDYPGAKLASQVVGRS